MQEYVGSLLRQQGMSKAVAEEMAVIPGMEEVVSLLHIYRQAQEGHYDRVIVDAAPTGETVRLLTVPETFQWYVGRIAGWGDGTSRLATGLLRRFIPERDVLTGLTNLVEGVKALQRVFIDPEVTSYRVVLNPEKMVVKEGARAVTYFSLFGYPVDAVMVNRILPGVASDGRARRGWRSSRGHVFCASYRRSRRAISPISSASSCRCRSFAAEWFDIEMVGFARLEELAVRLVW